MKNLRGASVQNVRAAVWHVFGCERLPPLKKNAVPADIVSWKQSEEVLDCYRALFEMNEEGVFWVSIIARAAFSMVAVPILSNEHCAFTLAVCDILLNPKSRSVTCSEKRLMRRIERYLVSAIINCICFINSN